MKVRIIKCSPPSHLYKHLIGEVFKVCCDAGNSYVIDDNGSGKYINKADCEVVDDNMDFLKHRMTEEKMDEVYFHGPAFESKDKAIKMSIDTAREMYKDSTISTKNWLLENFTKEELEPKKGFTWEESIGGNGYYIHSTSRIYSLYNPIPEPCHINAFKTREQAESSLAFAQLSHIVARYNEGKERESLIYVVRSTSKKGLDVLPTNYAFHLEFYSAQDACVSMEVNRSLWEQYWMLKKD